MDLSVSAIKDVEVMRTKKRNQIKFVQLILNSPDHQVLNFVYGDDSDLLMTDFEGTYKMLSVRLAKQVFDAQQAEIDNLKNQLNNMESYKLNRLG